MGDQENFSVGKLSSGPTPTITQAEASSASLATTKSTTDNASTLHASSRSFDDTDQRPTLSTTETPTRPSSAWSDSEGLAAPESIATLATLAQGVENLPPLTTHGMQRKQGSLEVASDDQIAGTSEVIQRQTQVVRPAPDECDALPARLQFLGALFSTRFARFDRLADLDQAVIWHRYAIDLLHDRHSTKSVFLHCLGLLSWTRYDRSGDVRSMDDAVASWRHAVQLLETQTTAEFTRFKRFCDQHLEWLISAFRYTVRQLPNERSTSGSNLPNLRCVLCPLAKGSNLHHNIKESLEHLITYFVARIYDLETNHPHMDDAIATLTLVGAIMSQSRHEFRTAHWYCTAQMSLCRFKDTKSDDDLQGAIRRFILAEEYPIKPLLYAHFVGMLCRGAELAFEHLDDLREVRRLLAMVPDAVGRIPCGHKLKAKCYASLGSCYMTSFARLHSAADLDAAVDAYRNAISISATPLALHNLANALRKRFRIFAVDKDIDEAINLFTQAIQLARESNRDSELLPTLHLGLEHAYKARYNERSNLPSDLVAAMDALKLSRPENWILPTGWSTFVPKDDEPRLDISQLDSRIQSISHTANTWDLSARMSEGPNLDHGAFHTSEPAVKARLCQALSMLWARRYELSGELNDRERAVQLLRDASLLFQAPYEKLVVFNTIGDLLSRWCSYPSSTPEPSVLREIMDANLEAWNCLGPAKEMFETAVKRADLCFDWLLSTQRFGNPDDGYRVTVEQGLEAYQRALDVIPQIAWEGHSIHRRFEEMIKMSGLVRTAVGIAAIMGNEIMLKWFEQGRALVWNQIRDLRTGLDGVESSDNSAHLEENPTASSSFTALTTEGVPLDIARNREERGKLLKVASAAFENAQRQGTDAATLRRLSERRQHLVSSIRSLDSLEGFLRPKEVSDLVLACKQGSVVCINIQDAGCIAIIVHEPAFPRVQALRLPNLHPSKAREWRRCLNLSLGLRPPRSSEAATFASVRTDTVQVLRELWACVVKPVLDMIGISSDAYPSNGHHLRPHVTWCTTGPLAFLPLHAAGPYVLGLPNAFDLVVSSYTSNISSLLPRDRPAVSTSQRRILVVAQPNVVGFTYLPGTLEEAENVRKIFPGTCTILEGPLGTTTEVLNNMATHAYVHLACHGEQNQEDPLRSSFILADGKLTLEMLMAQTSSVAELAFLSACETATGDEKVPDEAVHLAAGMLAVGYRSVIATMWSIGDIHAPLVADVFYKKLLAQQTTDGRTDVARALHDAVEALKQDVGEKNFAAWVPFVHFGV